MSDCMCDGVCCVIDAGLATCKNNGNYCTDTLCPLMKDTTLI